MYWKNYVLVGTQKFLTISWLQYIIKRRQKQIRWCQIWRRERTSWSTAISFLQKLQWIWGFMRRSWMRIISELWVALIWFDFFIPCIDLKDFESISHIHKFNFFKSFYLSRKVSLDAITIMILYSHDTNLYLSCGFAKREFRKRDFIARFATLATLDKLFYVV